MTSAGTHPDLGAVEVRTFHLKYYLAKGEAFHIASSVLPSEPPGVLHDHDYFEVFWITQGGCMHYVNGRARRLRKGDMVFVRPPDLHGFRSAGEAPCHIVNLAFPAEAAGGYLERYGSRLSGRFFWAGGGLPDERPLGEVVLADVDRRVGRLEEDRGDVLALDQFLLTVFSLLSESRALVRHDMPEWLSRACEKALEPEVFSRGAAGFVAASMRGHEHVCRSARRFLGCSPTAYVNRVRMDYAARRLSHSDRSIGQIALECGFENMAHFYQLFNRQHGMTPLAYRRLRTRDLIQPAG